MNSRRIHCLTLLIVARASSGLVLAAEEGGQANNIFNADVGNFIFTLLIFGLVVLLLGRFAWQPLLKVLNEREATIRDSIEAARRERQQAEQLLADYQRKLDEARQEASAIVDEGRRDAEVAARRIQEEARQEAERMVERAKREIQLASESAVKELYDQTAELSVKIAGGILGREVSAEQHKDLVADSLAAMKQSQQPSAN